MVKRHKVALMDGYVTLLSGSLNEGLCSKIQSIVGIGNHELAITMKP